MVGGGGGVTVMDFRGPGGNAFWNFRRQGKVKIWKLSVVGYGYYLELPNLQCMCQLTQYRSICYLICCKRV